MRYKRKYCTFLDENFEEHEGLVLEVNGNLTLVECAESGAIDWKCPFEVEECRD